MSYKCELCEGTYNDGSQENTEKEFLDSHPHKSIDDSAIVCDYCYQKILLRETLLTKRTPADTLH